MKSNKALLSIKGISKSFESFVAVDKVSIDVQEGSITALIGPNGAGKTTLFNLTTGFIPIDTGQVIFSGERIDHLPAHKRVHKGLSRTFQIPRIFSRLTVLENLLMADQQQPGERLFGCFTHNAKMRQREEEAKQKAHDLLKLLNVSHIAEDYAGSMSGGQRKLIELGRVLMTDPKMIMLDEPMAGVNPTLGQKLLEKIQQLRADLGLTFLFVEHDMAVVMSASDRVIVLDEGRLIGDGSPDEIRSNPRVIEAYLGAQSQPRKTEQVT